jgi:hypothetical protein
MNLINDANINFHSQIFDVILLDKKKCHLMCSNKKRQVKSLFLLSDKQTNRHLVETTTSMEERISLVRKIFRKTRLRKCVLN